MSPGQAVNRSPSIMSCCILESFSTQLPGHSFCLGTRETHLLQGQRERERERERKRERKRLMSFFLSVNSYDRIPVQSRRQTNV